jgi:transposase-like protein
MAEARRKFDVDFKVGAVRIVRESGKPIAMTLVKEQAPAKYAHGWRRTASRP